MGLLTSLLLGALGVGVAMANTNENMPAVTTPEEWERENERVQEHRRLQEAARLKGEKPSQRLGPHEWIDLLRELGWWDAEVSEGLFWERLDAWDAKTSACQAADQTGTSEARSPLSS